MSNILSKIPAWLGFLCLIIIGIAMFLNGVINAGLDHTNTVGFIIFGLCAAGIGAFSWIVGGTSAIKGRTGKVGVKVAIGDLPWWGWLVDLIVLVVCVILFFVLK